MLAIFSSLERSRLLYQMRPCSTGRPPCSSGPGACTSPGRSSGTPAGFLPAHAPNSHEWRAADQPNSVIQIGFSPRRWRASVADLAEGQEGEAARRARRTRGRTGRAAGRGRPCRCGRPSRRSSPWPPPGRRPRRSRSCCRRWGRRRPVAVGVGGLDRVVAALQQVDVGGRLRAAVPEQALVGLVPDLVGLDAARQSGGHAAHEVGERLRVARLLAAGARDGDQRLDAELVLLGGHRVVERSPRVVDVVVEEEVAGPLGAQLAACRRSSPSCRP